MKFKVFFIMILALLAAQFGAAQEAIMVYEGTETTHSVENHPGSSYFWEVYKEFNPDVPADPTEFYFVDADNTNPASIHWIRAGIYFVKVTETDTEGCTNVKALAISVIPNNRTIEFASSASNACFNSADNSFQLAIEAFESVGQPLAPTDYPLQVSFDVNGVAYSQTVTFNNQTISITNNMFVATPQFDTNINVKITGAKDNQNVNINPSGIVTHTRIIYAVPVIEFTTTASDVIQGDTEVHAVQLLTGNSNNATYTWHLDPPEGSSTNVGAISTSSANIVWDGPFGDYTLSVFALDGNGCLSSTINQQIKIVEPEEIVVDAGRDSTIGSCEPYQLEASVSDTTGLSYLWEPADNLNDASILNPVFTPGSSTVFVLTVTDARGNIIADTVSITVSEIIADAGDDVSVEEGELVELNGTASVGDTLQYSWTSQSGTIESGADTPTPMVRGAGTYYLEITDLYSCTAIDSVKVSEFSVPLVVDAGQDTTIGSCTPYLLQASVSDTSGLSYSWTPIDYLDNPSILNPVFTPGNTTTFILTVSDKNGDVKQDSVTITVSEIVADAGNDVQIEEGGTVILDGSASFGNSIQYLWTTTNGIIVSGETTMNPVVSSIGTYLLQITDFYGCTDTNSVRVISGGGNLPIVDAGSDTLIGSCEAYQLDARVSDTTGLTYLWEPVESLNDPTLLNPEFTPGTTTTFILTVTNSSGIPVKDTVTISVDEIYANAGEDLMMERDETTILDGSSSFGRDIQYLWSTNIGVIDSGENTANPIVSSAGTYYLSVTDFYGCNSIDSMTVSYITYAPIANDDYDTTSYQTAVNIPVLDNDEHIDPTTIEIVQFPVNGTVYINYDDYTVNYTPADGFTGSDVFEYKICNFTNKCDNAHVYVLVTGIEFLIPNAFTPNGDNINDYFEIKGIEFYSGNSFTVVNRWGNTVYEARNYGIDTNPKYWDGTWQEGGDGSELPTGTYFYILDLGNGEAAISGSIYLDR